MPHDQPPTPKKGILTSLKVRTCCILSNIFWHPIFIFVCVYMDVISFTLKIYLLIKHYRFLKRQVRSGGLVFPSLSEFSTVCCDPHSQMLWHSHSWQIDGETVHTGAGFILGGSKITGSLKSKRVPVKHLFLLY